MGKLGIEEFLEGKKVAETTASATPAVPPVPAVPAEVIKGVAERKVEKVEVIEEVEAKDLAVLLTRGWVTANRLPEQSFEINEVLFQQPAKEALEFALEAKSLLKDASTKERLAKMARFTETGEISFLFKSIFFGPAELWNLKHARLTRCNLALAMAIGIIENTKRSCLYSRLTGWGEIIKGVANTFHDWRGLNWDAFNAHVGLDAGRFLSGQRKDAPTYGPDSQGGVLVTDEERRTVFPWEIRLLVMLQPFILAWRCYQSGAGKQVADFAMTDEKGEVVGKDLLASYSGLKNKVIGRKRFDETYKGLQEFCKKYPKYNWILTESIV